MPDGFDALLATADPAVADVARPALRRLLEAAVHDRLPTASAAAAQPPDGAPPAN